MAPPTKSVEPKALSQPKPSGVMVQDLKSVMSFFNSTPFLQKLYAEHVTSRLALFIGGTTTEYPHDLNTPRDIADFVLKNRNVKIGEADESLADAFLMMHIAAASPKRKKGRELQPEEEKNKKTKVVKPTTGSGPHESKNVILKELPKIETLSMPLSAVPLFLDFFPHPKAEIFSSNGGLHDVTCALCREIGFYNVVDGKKRGLLLHQKRWATALHQEIGSDGKSIMDIGKLKACTSYLRKPTAAEAMDTTGVYVTFAEGNRWSDLPSNA